MFISACIAWRAISKNQDVNRRRATLDLIEKSESSEHYRVILTTFRDYLLDGDAAKRLKIHNPTNDAERLARRQVQQFLNHYELVSIGILGKSLHEKTYREWMMTVVIRDWNASADYIQRERWKYDAAADKWTYEPRVYGAFEKLTQRWGKTCGRVVTEISRTSSEPPGAPRGAPDMAAPKVEKDVVAPPPPVATTSQPRSILDRPGTW